MRLKNSALHFVLAALLILSTVVDVDAQRSRSHSRSHSSGSGKHRSTYSTTAPRDSHGKIKRSSKAKEKFMKQSGYPKGRPGYVVDHIVPLSKGGSDSPSNMQWQTKADAKAKDKWERGQSKSPKKYKTNRR
jgi:hypothetical protein